MPSHVALLRGINLGPRRVKMDLLRELFLEMNLTDVATVLASGNVVFATRSTPEATLSRRIARHLEKHLGYIVPTCVRSRNDLHRVITQAPFGDLFTDAPHANTQVTFFPDTLPSTTRDTLESRQTSTDRLQAGDRVLYWRCATKLSASPLWKHRQANPHNWPDATTRNLQTLTKILAHMG